MYKRKSYTDRLEELFPRSFHAVINMIFAYDCYSEYIKIRNFKSKISKIFWGGVQPLPRPHPRGEGTLPSHAPPPRSLRPLSVPPLPFPEILDPPLE